MFSGRPFPLVNCTITNYTDSGLEVECLESFDGGLPQSFQMELLQYPSLVSKYNVTTTRSPPIFALFGIDTSATYQVKVYAINAKGVSDPVVFDQIYFRGVTNNYISKYKYIDNNYISEYISNYISEYKYINNYICKYKLSIITSVSMQIAWYFFPPFG